MHTCVEVTTHAPCPAHVPLLCQAPLVPHVCVSVPQLPHATGFVWPGAHTPAHVPVPGPDTQVLFVQPTAVLHAPLVLHVSTPLPEQLVAPGLPWPAQAPATHAWSVQAVGVPQVPETQDCTEAL